MGREKVGRKTDGAAGEVGENQEQVAGEPSGKLRQAEPSALSRALRNSRGSPEKGLLDVVTWRSRATHILSLFLYDTATLFLTD